MGGAVRQQVVAREVSSARFRRSFGVRTVAEWTGRWFRSLDLDRRMIESYRSRLRCHVLPKFGDLSLGAITALG